MSNHISFKWSEDIFLEGAYIAYRHNLKHSPKRFLGWLFIAMFQFGVVATLRNHTIGLLLISTILLIYWYGLRWKIRRFMLKRLFKESDIDISFDKDGIEINGNKIEWSQFRDAIISERGYLLEIDSRASIYIPKRVFDSDSSRESFVSLVRKKIAKIYDEKE